MAKGDPQLSPWGVGFLLAVVVLLLGAGGAVALAAAAPVSIPCTQDGRTVTCTINPVTTTVRTTVRATVTATAPASTVTVTPSAPATSAADPSTTTTATPTSSTTPTTTATTAATTPPAAWPGPSNTGVPAGVTPQPWTGACSITADGAVIDGKHVYCPDGLAIKAKSVVIRNSFIQGHIWMDTDINPAWSLTITDSDVDGGTDTTWPTLAAGNIIALRVNLRGGHNGLECADTSAYCELRDSWIHGQAQQQGVESHLGGFLSLGAAATCNGPAGRCLTLVHNTIVCDAPVAADGGGCTGGINLLPHFSALHDVLIEGNLIGANVGQSFCTYGGAGMEHPATSIVYRNNVFQRGTNRQCAAYGPVTNFDSAAAGNSWTGNVYDDGAAIAPAG